MQILVTGATGYIGRLAVSALLGAGHGVRALVRDPGRADRLLDPRAVQVVGSALSTDDVRAALEGCDGLLQAAGVYSYRRRDAGRVLAETPALARSVLGAASAAGTPLVVDISSVVALTTETARIDETTRLARPGDRTWGDPYVRAKVAAEQVGRTFEDRGLPRVTLHPVLVIGPDDRGPGQSGQVLLTLLRGGATTNGRGGWVDVRDVAAAIVAAFDAPPGTRAVLCAATLSYRNIADRLDRLTGLRPRRSFIPHRVLRPLARINDAAGGRLAAVPIAGALEVVLTTPEVVDGSSAESRLGITYRDIDQTLADAVRWWASAGILGPGESGRLG